MELILLAIPFMLVSISHQISERNSLDANNLPGAESWGKRANFFYLTSSVLLGLWVVTKALDLLRMVVEQIGPLLPR